MFIADISPGSVLVIGVFVLYLNCCDERMKSVCGYVLCMQNHIDPPHTCSVCATNFKPVIAHSRTYICIMVHTILSTISHSNIVGKVLDIIQKARLIIIIIIILYFRREGTKYILSIVKRKKIGSEYV